MKLNVVTLKDSELYNRRYQKFIEEPEIYDRPDPETLLLPHNIIDALIVGYKVFLDYTGDKRIGIYTTLEDLSFFMVPFDEDTILELDSIINDHNYLFLEPQMRLEEEVAHLIKTKE